MTSPELWRSDSEDEAVAALRGLYGEVTAVPDGEWEWSGYMWVARSWGGGPGANGLWDSHNVGIDEFGNLHLRVNRVDGELWSAEVDSVDKGRGYGTYTFQLGSPVHSFGKHIVAGLFTYDNDAPESGHREFDIEASAWGGPGPVAWSHGYWTGPEEGDEVALETMPASTDSATKHVLIWTPGQAMWRTYSADGSLLSESDATDNVAVPGEEQVMMNLWVFKGQDDEWQSVRPAELVIKHFTFEPMAV